MKNLMNLEGVRILGKVQQKAINGGLAGKCSDSCANGNPPGPWPPWPCYHNNDCNCPGWCTSQGCQPI